MKKTIFITLCCASLMLVTPLTSVAQENTVSNNLPEQPNDVEGLVAQIRVVIDEISEKYSHIPIITKQCGIILNLLELFRNMTICIFSIMLFIPLITFATILYTIVLTFFRFVYLEFLMYLAFLFASYAFLCVIIAIKYCEQFILMIPLKLTGINMKLKLMTMIGH